MNEYHSLETRQLHLQSDHHVVLWSSGQSTVSCLNSTFVTSSLCFFFFFFKSRGFLVSISVHSALLAIVHSAYYMTSHEDSASHSLSQWLCISDDWVLWWLPQVSSKGHKLVLATLNSFLNSSSCYRVRISSYIIRHSVLFLKFNAQTKVLRWTMRFHCKYNLGHRITH